MTARRNTVLARVTACTMLACTLNPCANAECPELLVPAYQYPTVGTMWADLAQPTHWARINVILNPNSGPGTSADPFYVSAIAAARAAGCRMFGYVATSYSARPASQITTEVSTYLSLYGPLDGVFLDEMDNQPASLAYYQNLRTQILALIPGAIIIGNPGTRVPESFFAQNAADVIVTYENSADNPLDLYSAAVPESWTAGYPASRFAHIVYNVPTPEQMRSTLALANSRRAGWFYITNDALPNPYDSLPAYWQLERRACIADFNCLAGVSVQDIFDFLTAWFAAAPRADINAAGGVTVQDIFDLLSAWFGGC